MSILKRIYDVDCMRRKAASHAAYCKRFPESAWSCEYCVNEAIPAPFVFGSVLEDMHMSILAGVFGSVKRGGGDRAAVDTDFEKRCPYLLELLTATPKVNGRSRQTSTMTIVAEDGMWKAGLRDRQELVSLWVSGESLQAALDALETALHADVVQWRRTPEAYSRNRKG